MNARTATTLETLIEAGLLEEGQRLYASKTFRDEPEPRHFVGELTREGNVRILDDGGDGSINGKVWSASAAITALYRRPDGGWKNWKVERDGQRVLLDTIRNEHDLRLRAPALESLDQAPEVELAAPTATSVEVSPDFDS